MVKLVAMTMGDTGRMNCWKTTSAQYPTAHLTAMVGSPVAEHQRQQQPDQGQFQPEGVGSETR